MALPITGDSAAASDKKDLLDCIEYWAQEQPNKVAFSFLDDGGEITQSLTYAEINLQSSRLGAHLISLPGVKAGDRVLLVYPPSLQFIVAFLGCLKAGLIAVPTFPPDPAKLNKDLAMFSVIAQSCTATLALTSSLYSLATKLAAFKSAVLFDKGATAWPEQLTWIVTDSVLNDPSLVAPFASRRSEIAFLQYTSGSTSEPKGVVITRAALAHNLTLIVTGLRASKTTVVVSWLPQYHDMGLIGSYLGALYCGGAGYYLSPVSFIRNPVLWMVAMSRYRATHVQAPNFAYALTARKFLAHVQRGPKQGSSMAIDASFDLSSLQHMINAAEPVEAASIDLFYAVFCKFGLPRCIFPTYGLAEHCVYVCSNGKERVIVDKTALERDCRVKEVVVADADSASDHVVVLGCGRPADSASVVLVIVDIDGLSVLPEGRVGEVWIKSSSQAAGYWGLPDKTAEDFGASLSEDCGEGSIHGGGEGGFLRTGDLGFLCRGEVFICGRLKDLVIIRGRNHYPQDIERTAEAVAVTGEYDEVGLRGGCSAAFSVSTSGQEMLVYAAEVTSSKLAPVMSAELFDKIRQEVSRVHGVLPAVILLLEPRTIPKTTSGKIARQWTRRGYLEGTLKVLDSWSSADAQGNEGIEASAVPAVGLLGAVEHDQDAVDPTGQPLEFVLGILKRAVATCVEQDNAEGIATDVPLMHLGMDSLRGVQLQALLERKFTVPLPEELMFEPDATLRTIGTCLVAGGVVRSRPVMLNMWDVVAAVRKIADKTPPGRQPPSGPLPNIWFRERQRRADVDTHLFPDGCATPKATLNPGDATLVWRWASAIKYGRIGIIMAAFLLSLLGLLLLPSLSVGVAVAAVLASLAALSISRARADLENLGTSPLRRSATFEALVRHFSLRVITERPVDLSTTPAVFAVASSIQELALPQTFLIMLSEFFLGKSMRHALGETEIKKALRAGVSVCLGFPGSSQTPQADMLALRRNKDFVVAAIESGAQLVPCFCFGAASCLAKLEERPQLLMVIGRPIACPLVQNPTLELVNEMHEVWLREVKRLHATHQRCIDPRRGPLLIIR